MANPQTEHGYTKVADEILEALMRIRISGEAMQVLLCIIRQTYGFNKKKDKIALSQFSKKTGIKRQHVMRAIKKLENMKLIRVTNNGYMEPNSFSVVKDYEKWKPLPKKVTEPKKVTVVTNNGSGLYPIKGHTINTITIEIFKEIITYLNEKAGKGFRFTNAHRKHIQTRWGEGFTIEDFKKAIDNKVTEWSGTENDRFLRPETLFGNKMDGYVNQKITETKKKPGKVNWY